jgi:DNA topoisomerase-2
MSKVDIAGAKHYTQKDPMQHVRDRCEVYIGSVQEEEKELRVLDLETNKFKFSNIKVSDGLEKIFFEILNNASDNIFFSYEQNMKDVGPIKVLMNRKTIRVSNSGYYFKITKIEDGPSKGEWNQSVVFGKLFTSSNYEDTPDKAIGAGVNGVGSKGCNGTSTYFNVVVEDPIHKRTFEQTWSKGFPITTAKVEDDEKVDKTLVQITYTADFVEKYKTENNNYNDGVYELFAAHCADVAVATKNPVLFSYSFEDETENDFDDDYEYITKEFNFQNLEDYATLIENFETIRHVYHEEKHPKLKYKSAKEMRDILKYQTILNDLEIMFFDTIDKPMVISMVNGALTRENGIHADESMYIFAKQFINYINGIPTEHNEKDKKKEKKEKKVILTFPDVRKVMSCIVIFNTKDAKFNGNFKTRLNAPKPSITLKDVKILKDINDWNIYGMMKDELEHKMHKVSRITDGKKVKRVMLKNSSDANYAGTDKSHGCTLFLVEGQSASAYPKKLIEYEKDTGKNYYGYMCLKGKPMNMMKKSDMLIEKNTELASLKTMLGLKDGYDYTIEDNFKTLRYGKVVIMADADTDGCHITALIISNFFEKFSSLIKRNDFLYYYRTPVIRLTVNKTKKRIFFYNTIDYDKWAVGKDLNKYDIKYFKGLGTCDDKEIKEDLEEGVKIVSVQYDTIEGLTEHELRCAFSNEGQYPKERKERIMKFREESQIFLPIEQKSQYVSNYIQNDFMSHPIDNVHRCLPNFMDGLKESSRKVLYTSFIHWKKPLKSLKKDSLKVVQLAGSTSEKTAYKHGEASLCNVITGMMQDYVGSNNIPLLLADGQAGTRIDKGKDAAAPRYLKGMPMGFWRYVFRDEDDCLLEHIFDDGQKCEPKTFYPIIPWLFVNGSEGIATGFSSTITPRNPEEIILWYLMKIDGVKDIPEPLPYWKGFKGNVEIIDRDRLLTRLTPDEVQEIKERAREETEGTEDSEESRFIGITDEIFEQKKWTKKRNYLKIEGLYEYKDKDHNTLIINEIPFRSIKSYLEFLDNLTIKNKEGKPVKAIVDYSDLSGTDSVNIIIKLHKDFGDKRDVKKFFNLEKYISMCNMVVLDKDRRPLKFDSVQSFLEMFYVERLKKYDERKEKQKEIKLKKIETVENKLILIKALISEEIKYMKLKKSVIIEQMKEKLPNVPIEILDMIKITNLTVEEIEKLENEIIDMKNEYDKYSKLQPEQIWKSELLEFLDYYRKNLGGGKVRFISKVPY